MPKTLPRSRPADQQVDPAAIIAFLDAVDDHPGVEMHSLMVVRHGQVVAEGWWAPYSAERPHLLYSLSKSFTSTAAAFAQAEGLFGLDDTVVSHFGEFDADITDPRSRSMRIRHVAAMASGHTREMLGEAIERDRAEPVRGFLLIPPDREPGFSGLHARTEDIAKLGQLYLQRGRWDGAQLIPEQWVEQATSMQVGNPGEPAPDWRQGYGFQFWMSRHGYRGDGAFGQFCVVLPEHDTVIVTTACTLDMQAVLDAMWTHLLPGLGTTAAGDTARQDQLGARLGGLELPACPAERAPADWHPWTAAPFPVAVSAAGTPARAALTSVEVVPKAGGWQISLGERANTLAFPVGAGAWTVSTPVDSRGGTIPVAASGGWLDDHTLRAEIIFLETPHRMDITCSLPGRTATAAWRHPPLTTSRLQDLHCPS